MLQVALNAACFTPQLEFGLYTSVWMGFDDFICSQEHPSYKVSKAFCSSCAVVGSQSTVDCSPTYTHTAQSQGPLQGRAALRINPTPSPNLQSVNANCSVIVPTADWVFDRSGNGSTHNSCSNPPIVNLARMCQGDPTSIVMDASLQNDGIGCFRAQALGCKFNLRQVAQIDFDITMSSCYGVWASFWANPNYWAGGGQSGEMDWMESCDGEWPACGCYGNLLFANLFFP